MHSREWLAAAGVRVRKIAEVGGMGFFCEAQGGATGSRVLTRGGSWGGEVRCPAVSVRRIAV